MGNSRLVNLTHTFFTIFSATSPDTNFKRLKIGPIHFYCLVVDCVEILQVVSVSRTPGHTKHFQTIYLTPTVKLCDSPGIVFPSVIPKPMQVS